MVFMIALQINGWAVINIRMVIFIILGLVLLGIGILGYRALQVFLSVNRYAIFWQNKADEPNAAQEFKLVALGDSTVQAIGATKPLKGIVGKAAEYAAQKTRRPVHITNLGKSGGKIADVTSQQLPKLKEMQPDLVLVSVGANDATKQTDIAEFERNYRTMIEALPKGKTALGGVPFVKNRGAYEQVVQKLAKEYGLPVAPIFETMKPYEHDWSTYAADFFHPSNKGYRLWFTAFSPKIDEIIKQPQNLKMLAQL